MRKKILTSVCALGFILVGAYVVSKNAKQAEFIDLVLDNIEAYAHGGWNGPGDWWEHGFTKDEREQLVVVSKRIIKIRDVIIEENKIGIICVYGNQNCTPTCEH